VPTPPAVFVAATLTAQASPYLKPTRHVEVRKGLGGRVDLVVVSGSRKASQFGHIVSQPRGIAWQKHKAVFEPRVWAWSRMILSVPEGGWDELNAPELVGALTMKCIGSGQGSCLPSQAPVWNLCFGKIA